MHICNFYLELCVWSGYMCYRFPILIDMFPIVIFRSRYPVIPVSVFRPPFMFPFPFPTKKAGTVLEFSRPFSSVHVASSGPSGVAIGDGPEKSRKRSEQRSTRRREFPNVRRLTYPSVRRLTYPNFLKIDLKITHFLWWMNSARINWIQQMCKTDGRTLWSP